MKKAVSLPVKLRESISSSGVELSKAEADAKAQAEENAREAQRKVDEIEAQRIAQAEEAQRLAKAPIKEQLSVWVASFSLVENPLPDNEVAFLIQQKFDAFKVWAEAQVVAI